jgi:hypothetical protein
VSGVYRMILGCTEGAGWAAQAGYLRVGAVQGRLLRQGNQGQVVWEEGSQHNGLHGLRKLDVDVMGLWKVGCCVRGIRAKSGGSRAPRILLCIIFGMLQGLHGLATWKWA